MLFILALVGAAYLGVFFQRFPFTVYHSSNVTSSPLGLVFFYSAELKSSENHQMIMIQDLSSHRNHSFQLCFNVDIFSYKVLSRLPDPPGI